MPHLPTSPSNAPFLLQAAEATKAAAEAAGAVSKHAAGDAFTALLWLGLVVAIIIAVWQFFDNRKLRTAKDEAVTAKYLTETQVEANKASAIKAALMEARTQWQQEMALDLGHEQDMFKQARQQYEGEIQRLREDNKEKDRQLIETNKELRQQESKNAQVLEATANSLRGLVKTGQISNINQREILRVLALLAPTAQVQQGLSSELL